MKASENDDVQTLQSLISSNVNVTHVDLIWPVSSCL